MDYLFVIIMAVLIVPLMLAFLTRRPGNHGNEPQRDHGVTYEEPSSDEPSPGIGTVNQLPPDAEKLPPPA